MNVKIKETLIPNRSRTVLGKRLLEIRARIIRSGEKLLDWDDLEKEIAERRGDMRRIDNEEAGLR